MELSNLTVGKTYVFLGIPLWFRGELEKESVFGYFLKAGTAYYLGDAQNMSDYLAKKPAGEKLSCPVFVPREGTFVLEVG